MTQPSLRAPLMVDAYEMQRVQLDESGFKDMVDRFTKLPEFSKYSVDHKKLYDLYISINENNLDQSDEIQTSIM